VHRPRVIPDGRVRSRGGLLLAGFSRFSRFGSLAGFFFGYAAPQASFEHFSIGGGSATDHRDKIVGPRFVAVGQVADAVGVSGAPQPCQKGPGFATLAGSVRTGGLMACLAHGDFLGLMVVRRPFNPFQLAAVCRTDASSCHGRGRKQSSNLVVSTIFRNEPIGENVEGLSHCGNKGYSSTSLFNQRNPLLNRLRRN
jgi:hypothetical protein